MALEDRVKELEEELKVLKNEIQTTLLDIQEQILSHYYPSLYPSANKEANSAQYLAHENEAYNQTIAQAPPPQQAPVPLIPIAATTLPEAAPTSRFSGKYKTRTVTLAEEPEEEEVEEPEPFEDEEELPRPAVVSKATHKKPKPSVNGHRLDHKAPVNPPAGSGLTDEDEAFLDAIVAKSRDIGPEAQDVSFEDFKEVLTRKSSDADEEVANEDLIDELLKDSFFEFSAKNLNRVTDLPTAGLPGEEDIPESDSISKLAVRSTVRKLLTWIDESVAIIGKNPTKQAIAMYVRAGDLSAQMHQTLLLLVDSSQADPATEKAGLRQIIDTLGELNDILDHHTPDYLDQVLRFITEVNFG